MIAEAIRRSALADYAARFAALSAASHGDLMLRELPFLTQVNLRVNQFGADCLAALQRELGFALPVEPNTVASRHDRWCLWLGPDEWLVVAPPDQQRELETALRSALGWEDGAIVDVSANRTVIEIGGSAARDLLAHGCSVDLDPRVFSPERCAQTLVAKAQVILHQSGTTPGFYIYVRASFASYLAEWLLDAGDAWTST